MTEFSFWRNTTEQFGISFSDLETSEPIDLETLDDVRIVISQGDTEIAKSTKDGDITISNNILIVDLTQDDTRAFASGTAQMQAHLLFNDGRARVSEEIAVIKVKDSVDRRKI